VECHGEINNMVACYQTKENLMETKLVNGSNKDLVPSHGKLPWIPVEAQRTPISRENETKQPTAPQIIKEDDDSTKRPPDTMNKVYQEYLSKLDTLSDKEKIQHSILMLNIIHDGLSELTEDMNARTVIFARKAGSVLLKLKKIIKTKHPEIKWNEFIEKELPFKRSSCEHYMKLALRGDLEPYPFLGLERSMAVIRATHDIEGDNQFRAFCESWKINLDINTKSREERSTLCKGVDTALILEKFKKEKLDVRQDLIREGVNNGSLTHRMGPKLLRNLKEAQQSKQDLNAVLALHIKLKGKYPRTGSSPERVLSERIQRLLSLVDKIKSQDNVNQKEIRSTLQHGVEGLQDRLK
jgi:hypothetical protein